MDTHFEFIAYLFLSKSALKYVQGGYRAVKFDGLLTNEELGDLLKEVYSTTNNFYYLRMWLNTKNTGIILMVMSIMTLFSFLVLVASSFDKTVFFIFLGCSVVNIITLVFALAKDIYYEKKSQQYEEVIIKVLESWNNKFKHKGIKFGLIRSYYVLSIHGDFKKTGYKYSLELGKKLTLEEEIARLAPKKSNQNRRTTHRPQLVPQNGYIQATTDENGQQSLYQQNNDVLGDVNIKVDYSSLRIIELNASIKI